MVISALEIGTALGRLAIAVLLLIASFPDITEALVEALPFLAPFVEWVPVAAADVQVAAVLESGRVAQDGLQTLTASDLQNRFWFCIADGQFFRDVCAYELGDGSAPENVPWYFIWPLVLPIVHTIVNVLIVGILFHALFAGRFRPTVRSDRWFYWTAPEKLMTVAIAIGTPLFWSAYTDALIDEFDNAFREGTPTFIDGRVADYDGLWILAVASASFAIVSFGYFVGKKAAQSRSAAASAEAG